MSTLSPPTMPPLAQLQPLRAIALTGRDSTAMAIVAQQLTLRSTERRLGLSLYLDVREVAEANAVYTAGGELWRIGQDLTRPELDLLIDRQIESATDEATLQAQVDYCLGLFLASVAATSGASQSTPITTHQLESHP